MRGMTVTVFGGTGFLGQRIVRALVRRNWTVRIAARHPARIDGAPADRLQEPVTADVQSDAEVARAVRGADAVVNAVSLYAETGAATFADIHVQGARRVAAAARRHGARLIHLSGIGADPGSRSAYVRARGQGEAAVRKAHGQAIVIRPSAMFGPNDALLSSLRQMTRWLPVVPLFGRGRTRLQPVAADDVAQAAARLAAGPETSAPLWEFGGPEVLSYRKLVKRVLDATERRRLLLPVPFWAWHILAGFAQILPSPPLTEGQVALMKEDNIADSDLPGLPDLGIDPQTIRAALASR